MLQVDSVSPVLTVKQMDERLPLVERIASDLVDTWGVVLRMRAALERGAVSIVNAEAKSTEELTEELERMVQRVQGYLKELQQLGGTFQEYRRGVVNFPMVRSGRMVLACWIPGESTIRGWHESHETVVQRKSL